MTGTLPVVYLSRHGDTAWLVTGLTSLRSNQVRERADRVVQRVRSVAGEVLLPVKRLWNDDHFRFE